MFDFQRQPQVVLADVYQVGKTLDQSQGDQDVGRCSNGDSWIALFKTGDGTG